MTGIRAGSLVYHSFRNTGSARAPACPRDRVTCFFHLCSIDTPARLCVGVRIVVLVPVLERRASVEFRHGHLPAVLLAARLELFRPDQLRTESEQDPPDPLGPGLVGVGSPIPMLIMVDHEQSCHPGPFRRVMTGFDAERLEGGWRGLMKFPRGCSSAGVCLSSQVTILAQALWTGGPQLATQKPNRAPA